MEFKKFCDYFFILEKMILFHLGFKLQIKLPGLLLSSYLALWFDIVPCSSLQPAEPFISEVDTECLQSVVSDFPFNEV